MRLANGQGDGLGYRQWGCTQGGNPRVWNPVLLLHKGQAATSIRNGSVYTQARRDKLEPAVLILSHAAAPAPCRQNMMLQRKRESYMDYLSTMIKNKMGLVRKTHAARIIQVTFLKKVAALPLQMDKQHHC